MKEFRIVSIIVKYEFPRQVLFKIEYDGDKYSIYKNLDIEQEYMINKYKPGKRYWLKTREERKADFFNFIRTNKEVNDFLKMIEQDVLTKKKTKGLRTYDRTKFFNTELSSELKEELLIKRGIIKRDEDLSDYYYRYKREREEKGGMYR